MGEDARILLENPLLRGAFAGVRENLVQAIEDNPVKNELQRDKLMLSLQLLRSVRDMLENHIIDGKLEKLNLENF